MTDSHYECVDVLSKYLIQAQPVSSLLHYTQLGESEQRLLVRSLLCRDPRGYPEAELLVGGRLSDQPVKIGGHRDKVIPDNKAGSEELIGYPISRVLRWLKLKANVIQLPLRVPHPQHQIYRPLVLRKIILISQNLLIFRAFLLDRFVITVLVVA